MDFLSEIDYVELIGSITTLLCVFLYTRQNIWSWPLGIVGAILFGIFFWEHQLYANLVLQGVYVALSIYGWYQWLYGGAQHDKLSISRITRRTALILVGGCVVTIGLMTWLQSAYLETEQPFLDSLTTVMCLAAQWMLAKKILENWLIWIIADVLYVGWFFMLEAYFFFVLYAILLILATSGFFAWRKAMRTESATIQV